MFLFKNMVMNIIQYMEENGLSGEIIILSLTYLNNYVFGRNIST